MGKFAKIFIGAVVVAAVATGNALAAYTCKKCYTSCNPPDYLLNPDGNGTGCGTCMLCKAPMKVKNGICGFFPDDNPLTLTDNVGQLIIKTIMSPE
ncbi:MAG: hypothetical protein FWC51_02720 [Proteobacteria bacterium]|nr:hypothetical protein [Pseudomonadota bacterium]